jgi:hypothetical protein
LTQLAKTLGKTRPAIVRELLDQAFSPMTIFQRAGYLKGTVQLPKPQDKWAEHLRKGNWR